ncbi:glycosyl hydrolase [Maribellus maritimus]|uniref:glycosyl hydrolase n=1 Tax=Maribellus maritimus TaxID=2870838 RepID=UPI001EE9E02B|nr:glycosyl hydrolase [Maribellus maritimus]MCG6191338.1 hypothetical protein [Maribellus maritimus]
MNFIIGFSILCILSSCNPKISNTNHFDYLKTDTSIDYKKLKEEFVNPPDQAKMRMWWRWMNGLATKESITRDLEEFKKKGIGGVLLFDSGNTGPNVQKDAPQGPPFQSAEWNVLYQYAIKEADRLGLEVSMNAITGWNPGGPFVTPEYAVKKLVSSEVEIEGGKLVQMELPTPDTNLIYEDIIIQAIKNQKFNSQTKDNVIKNWSLKSNNQFFGSRGNYPLYKLREYYDGSEKENVIQQNEILDITKYFNGEELNWDAPDGNWLIVRYGWTCKGTKAYNTSGAWNGLSYDPLNAKAFNLYGKHVILPLIESAQSVGNSLKYLFTDSWEMGTINWTNDFPLEFEKFRGYDINKYLPVLTGRIVGSREISNRFLFDFRRTISDCIAENNYQLFADLAHENNLGIHPESGGPHAAPIDAMQIMSIGDFPTGEFWARATTHRVSDMERYFVKQSASVAHTNGIRIVGAESLTTLTTQCERAPKDLKHDLDRAFCSGVNRPFHVIGSSSPPEYGQPGIINRAGNDLSPNVTWWEQSSNYIQYINRCCFMLQQGLFTADVLYYYGDDVPNFVYLKEDYAELNYGYDWDKCSKDVILNRASVSDGKIILPDGMSYRVLVLTPEETINLKVLRKVEQLVLNGATVLSPRPKRATGLSGYPESDNEVNEIAQLMWGDIDGKNKTRHQYGKGQVIWGENINNVLNALEVRPDFSFKSSSDKTALDYIHRKLGNQDIYFLVNRFAHHGINDFNYHYVKTLPDRYEQVECAFRVTGKIPELWNPMSGEIKKIKTYREENGQTVVPFHFKPEESFFVVFREASTPGEHVVKIEKDGVELFPLRRQYNTKATPMIDIYKKDSVIVGEVFEKGHYVLHWNSGEKTDVEVQEDASETEIKGSWAVHFDPKWGGPETIIFPELKSWLEFDDPGIKYYSGKATYVKDFNISKQDYNDKKIFLDLGMVQELAVIRLNSHTFPVTWMPPFKVEISDYLLDGVNSLEIDIVNQWANRLIGDSKLSKEKRFTKTNFIKFYQPGSEQYLRESGLIGPVKLQFVSVKNLSH